MWKWHVSLHYIPTYLGTYDLLRDEPFPIPPPPFIMQVLLPVDQQNVAFDSWWIALPWAMIIPSTSLSP